MLPSVIIPIGASCKQRARPEMTRTAMLCRGPGFLRVGVEAVGWVRGFSVGMATLDAAESERVKKDREFALARAVAGVIDHLKQLL